MDENETMAWSPTDEDSEELLQNGDDQDDELDASRYEDPAFERLLTFIRDNRGFDFSGYKRPTLFRRVTRRMSDVGATDFEDYQHRLAESSDEFNGLFNTVLINVTSFMRDQFAWEHLTAVVIPELLANKASDEPIRIWSAGCASGEEAYSLAMLFAEACGERRYLETVKIYATDIDEEALREARQATYRIADVRRSVSPDLIAKYFNVSDGVAAFRKDLRRTVIFGRNDLLQDPPISRIDLLSCRNTLMYFNAEVQNRILDNFHFALRNTGFLFLGKSEALLTRNQVFKPVDLKRRVFVKALDGTRNQKRVQMPKSNGDSDTASTAGAEDVLNANFEWSSVATVALDTRQRLVAANQQARGLLRLSAADIGRDLKDLELSYRPIELRSQVDKVRTEHYPVVVRDVRIDGRSGDSLYVDVQVSPLVNTAGHSLGVSVTFADITRYRDLQNQLQASKAELENAYEELQSTVEELETTNEELQSTNEELETTNEELQSTNEELETMNEELQSSNEELETINEELRSRTEDLNHANNFLESILGSLDSAVVVVGRDLEVLVWSLRSEDLWGLRNDEVLGRNFLNLDINLAVEQLQPSLKRALSTTTNEAEQIVLNAINRRGRQVNCRIRISPLLTNNDQVSGAIILIEASEPERSKP